MHLTEGWIHIQTVTETDRRAIKYAADRESDSMPVNLPSCIKAGWFRHSNVNTQGGGVTDTHMWRSHTTKPALGKYAKKQQ
jgi:hypothetical protein